MAMCYAGARENTAAELSKHMHFNPDQASFHIAFKDLHKQLLTGSKSKPTELTLVNALWGQHDSEFIDEYFEIANNYYSAEVRIMDFSQPEELETSRVRINKWVEDQTMNRITDLLKPGTLTIRTRLVLTNAIYFRASWVYPFDKNKTVEGNFRTSKDQKVTASFMNLNKPLFYYENVDLQAIELPYKGKELVMVVILPKELTGIQEAMTMLDYSVFTDIGHLKYKTEVRLSLPKFTSSAEFVLNDALKNMGINDAFSQLADFSGMTRKNELFISKVIHKTFIEVHEAGTEAAAASGVDMVLKSGMIAEPKIFTADHPFFYAIVHKGTGVILFTGWLENPS